MKRGDHSDVPAEFPVGWEAGNREDMRDDVAGEYWSESSDALDESVLVFPVFHGVAVDLLI